MKNWLVYILECADGSLYTGITNDLSRRIKEHKNGVGARYTKSHTVKECVYSEKSDSKSAALKREIEIKSLKREDKLFLISKPQTLKNK